MLSYEKEKNENGMSFTTGYVSLRTKPSNEEPVFGDDFLEEIGRKRFDMLDEDSCESVLAKGLVTELGEKKGYTQIGRIALREVQTIFEDCDNEISKKESDDFIRSEFEFGREYLRNGMVPPNIALLSKLYNLFFVTMVNREKKNKECSIREVDLDSLKQFLFENVAKVPYAKYMVHLVIMHEELGAGHLVPDSEAEKQKEADIKRLREKYASFTTQDKKDDYARKLASENRLGDRYAIFEYLFGKEYIGYRERQNAYEKIPQLCILDYGMAACFSVSDALHFVEQEKAPQGQNLLLSVENARSVIVYVNNAVAAFKKQQEALKKYGEAALEEPKGTLEVDFKEGTSVDAARAVVTALRIRYKKNVAGVVKNELGEEITVSSSDLLPSQQEEVKKDGEASKKKTPAAKAKDDKE